LEIDAQNLVPTAKQLPERPLILGISGASGLIYAVRALKFLLEADYAIEVVASKASYLVWQAESNIRMPYKSNSGASKRAFQTKANFAVIVGEM
jgi:3-polyprenyl-4-hydroxybenzoate decarboxylase